MSGLRLPSCRILVCASPCAMLPAPAHGDQGGSDRLAKQLPTPAEKYAEFQEVVAKLSRSAEIALTVLLEDQMRNDLAALIRDKQIVRARIGAAATWQHTTSVAPAGDGDQGARIGAAATRQHTTPGQVLQKVVKDLPNLGTASLPLEVSRTFLPAFIEHAGGRRRPNGSAKQPSSGKSKERSPRMTENRNRSEDAPF